MFWRTQGLNRLTCDPLDQNLRAYLLEVGGPQVDYPLRWGKIVTLLYMQSYDHAIQIIEC